MRRRLRLGPRGLIGIAIAAVAIITVIGARWSGGTRFAPGAAAALDLVQLLGGDPDGFEQALERRDFRFPFDHGPHPDFRSEWWYYTGNLESEGGRQFGFQLTFFRLGLGPRSTQRVSAWATRQAYLAHFSLTDLDAERFYSYERSARGALALAGATAAPFRVWLDDWEARGETARQLWPTRLRARGRDAAIDLALDEGKPLVLQGDAGLSRKSDAPGNASYYYSYPRLPVSGSIAVQGVRYEVRGAAWMDREWSTSALGPGQVGWDWFALQLSDDREIMFYRLRRSDGSADPVSAGAWVDESGAAHRLSSGDVELQALAHWTSPRTGARYPIRWRFRIPAKGLDLEISTPMPGQEVTQSVRYWEGAVRVTGVEGARTIAGQGYVELTGYD